MPRKKKTQIKINNNTSLEGLLQETYNDACSLINDSQHTINDMVNAAEPLDVDDLTKIAKEKTNALKVKDSGVKIKLEIAKLQKEILKNSESGDSTIVNSTSESVSLDDFRDVREQMKLEMAKMETAKMENNKLD